MKMSRCLALACLALLAGVALAEHADAGLKSE
jgi:hypothetical protein